MTSLFMSNDATCGDTATNRTWIFRHCVCYASCTWNFNLYL